MGKLTYFDCNCYIGRVANPMLYDISDANGLLEEMDSAGIEEALVFHIIARDGHPPLGNKLLLDEISTIDRLYPVWVILPHSTGEVPGPKELLQEMKSNKVKAVRLYPSRSYHSFSISEWCAGELLAALEEAKVPLMLDIEIVNWDDVHIIVEQHRDLPIIITNCSYRNDRFIYPLLERYNNIYIELSRYMGAGAVEHLITRFGAKNILFGTGMPGYTGSAAVSLLTYSDISMKDKQAIAGDNITSLLRGVKL